MPSVAYRKPTHAGVSQKLVSSGSVKVYTLRGTEKTTQRWREVQGDAGRCREMQGDAGRWYTLRGTEKTTHSTPAKTSTVPAILRGVMGALWMMRPRTRLVTSWIASRGASATAGAKAKATKLMMEAVRKIVLPMMKMMEPREHLASLTGASFPRLLASSVSSSISSRSFSFVVRPSACRLLPTLIPIEPRTPSVMPSGIR